MRTARMRELCAFIRQYQAVHDIPPSYEEMMHGVGLKSKSGIHRLITALEERGQISRLPGRARAITIHDEEGQWISVADLKTWNGWGWTLGDVLRLVTGDNEGIAA